MSKVRANNFTNKAGDGAPTFPHGANVTGVITATSFSGDGSALTGIDATAITNGTSNVSVASSGDITATRAGTQRLAVTSTGIDVTGSVTCDGITIDGSATIAANEGILTIKDNNSTGDSTVCYIRGDDSAGNRKWFVGDLGNSTDDLYLSNDQSGDLYFRTGASERAYFTGSDGHFVPYTTNAHDLGSSSLRWRNVYTNDLNLSNEGGANDVDGTWGSWTIQEGDDDLFLINRKNGKKYKFNLTEVN